MYIAVTYWVFFKLYERGRLMCISLPFAQDILINVFCDMHAKMYLVYWYQVNVLCKPRGCRQACFFLVRNRQIRHDRTKCMLYNINAFPTSKRNNICMLTSSISSQFQRDMRLTHFSSNICFNHFSIYLWYVYM